MLKPACFKTQAQFDLWRELAGEQLWGNRRNDFCVDCTPEYQREMIQAHKCAHPAVMFIMDRDGFLEGVRDPSQYHLKRLDNSPAPLAD